MPTCETVKKCTKWHTNLTNELIDKIDKDEQKKHVEE